MSKQIPLTQGKVAFVDDCDFERLILYKWHANKVNDYWYARRFVRNNKSVYMHSEVLGMNSSFTPDHKNQDTLDNRRENLRFGTMSQNQQNQKKRPNCSSKFKGVCWDRNRGKWMAHISPAGKFHFLGYFDNEIEAAKIYDFVAKQYFGEFARTNF